MKQFYKLFFVILALAAPLVGSAQFKGQQPSDPTGSNVFDATACVSYEWRGATYTQSDTYYDTVVNGSDTTVFTLRLIINQPSAGIDEQILCEPYTWIDGVTYTASTDTPTYTIPNGAATGCDSVVTLHLTINQPSATDIAVTECESFTWHGETYTQSGDYSDTLTNAAHCDSIVTLHLTIYHGTHNVFDTTVCESFTWHGTEYDTSGTYTFAYNNADGCASVDTLHLTVNYGTHNVETETACESFTWHGTEYDTSGTYTFAYNNADGCASVDTLHLTVNYGTHNVETETTCESFTWYGTEYDTSGTYTFAYNNANGCASVDTLHLTVNYVTHNVETETACESFTWHGTEYDTSGTYTFAYNNADGCASTDTLHLTINHGTHNVETETACESFTWHGTEYDTSGTYTFAYNNANGCASVDTLHLTIYPNYNTSINVGICQGESYIFFGDTLTYQGYYRYELQSVHCCDSIVTLHLTINDTMDTNEIVCKKKKDGVPYMLIYPQAGFLYQWYECQRDEAWEPIDTATKQYYAPKGGLQPGVRYKVRTAHSLSSCGAFTNEWSYESSKTEQLRILPNPNNGQFRLHLPDGAVSVQILNANGQVVMARKTDGDELLEMNTSLANGLYFVKTFLKDGSYNTEKLIINR